MRSTRRLITDHPGVAALARAERGTWFLAAVYPSLASARGAVLRIPRAERMPAYEPAGDFEAYTALHDNGRAVWVRYVGGDGPPVPELPESMTVRVCDRGTGPGYSGVCIVTVTVPAICPRCGGPRGVDTVTPQRFHEDGDWYVVDRWSNPCTHIDTYASVLRESRTLAPPPLIRSTDIQRSNRFAAAVDVVLSAARARQVHHAKQAAALLREEGHGEAAGLIETEIKKQHGHMSAKQAAAFLRDLADPGELDDSTAREDATA